MNLFIHIGAPKTGSSSIQRMLSLNAALLNDFGYNIIRGDDRFLEYGLTGEGQIPDIGMYQGNIIFTDERILSRLKYIEQIERLLDPFIKDGRKIRVICYIRREDESYLSSYVTRLISGETRKFNEIPLNPNVRYYKRLLPWIKILGQDSIDVRRFGNAYFEQGVVEDFAESIGLNLDNLTMPDRANSSPRTDVLELIRQLNALLPEGEPRRLALKLIATCPGTGEKLGLSRDDRIKIIRVTEAGNARLSNIFFGGEPLFSDALPDDQNSDMELTPAMVAAVINDVCARNHILYPRMRAASINDAIEWAAKFCKRLQPSVNGKYKIDRSDLSLIEKLSIFRLKFAGKIAENRNKH